MAEANASPETSSTSIVFTTLCSLQLKAIVVLLSSKSVQRQSDCNRRYWIGSCAIARLRLVANVSIGTTLPHGLPERTRCVNERESNTLDRIRYWDAGTENKRRSTVTHAVRHGQASLIHTHDNPRTLTNTESFVQDDDP